MRGQFHSQPAIGNSQLERRDADAIHAQQGQLLGLRAHRFPEDCGCFHGGSLFRYPHAVRKVGDAKQSGRTEELAEVTGP